MATLHFEKNPEKAEMMAKYMKYHFPFAGVPTPQRRQAAKPFLLASRNVSNQELIDMIYENFANAEREYHYFAIDLAQFNLPRLTLADLQALLPLVGEKAWWDSIDSWRKLYGNWTKQHLAALPEVFSWFYKHENFWYRRVGINLQMFFKEKTDLKLLEKALLFDLETDEFFIQKSIGWALKDLGKTNPEWVKNFIANNQLSKLAIREGSKYLK